MKTTFTLLFAILASLGGFCQSLVQGPDGPQVELFYNGSGFVFSLNNSPASNNYNEDYAIWDPNIDAPKGEQDWTFQGYMIYQVLDENVPLTETQDPDLARLAGVYDIVDDIAVLEYVLIDSLGGCTSHTLNGSNSGIPNQITLSEDAFSGEAFVEGNAYCFRVYAYGANLYNTSSDCNGMPDQMITSLKDDFGVIDTHCVEASLIFSVLESEQIAIEMYPNPAVDVLTISHQTQELVEIGITNMQGKQISSFISNGRTTLDLSDYAPGCYFVHTKINGVYSGTAQKIVVVNE